ncbi:retrotransposon protein, putative, ty1-copia subclass [Tanacetum coccineum]
MTGALQSDTIKNPKLNPTSTSSARSYPRGDPQVNTLTVNEVETPKSKEPEKALEDEFADLHLNLPVLEVLAHVPMNEALLYKYIENLELGKSGSAFIQGETPINMKDPGLLILPWLADGTKSYPVGIVKNVEVYVGKSRLFEDFHVVDMEREPTCPLLVGRGFLATASAVINCKKSKIAVGEGATSADGIGARPPFYARKDFWENHLPGEWEIARDAKVNPFKDILVFRKMVKFLGTIPINLKGNMWESEDLIDNKIDWNRPPKNGDSSWHVMIELIDPDGKKFDRVFQSIPTTRKLSTKKNLSDILNLDHSMMTRNRTPISLILIGLRKEFDRFVHNYNMHSMGKTVNELHAMLKLHEQTLPKNNAPALHAIRAAELLKKKKNAASGAGGSAGALSLYVGNGQRKAVEAIGVFYLCLPSGLEIVLNNYHYAPSITRGLISVSRLYEDGFINRFVNNTIQVFRNNMIYFSAIPRDGIFEIDFSNSYANESSIYTVSNKRAKLDLDSALLWHCRLGQISKKRIEKLQHDGLLNSTDLRAFEKCVPCMSEKMARKPYTHQVERAKDLLGLIHTDICGPFKIMSRQGASYFVTFTDDLSRYGNVYLLKHKHEVFETFKVFQKEIENQLDMTIKLLRSDRGGEYMSQKFLDHLKDHGIIAHRTPSYTLQHNGSFWDYALETAARILNMVPTKKVEKKPYEVWHGKAPKLSYLKLWGYEALIKRDTLTKPDKLEPRSIKCIFIGYPKETMGYSFYYPPENKVLVARNAEFLENSLITQEASGSLEDLEIIQEEDTHPSIDTSLNHEEDDLEIDEPQSDIIPIRRSTRTRRPTDRMCLYIDAEEHELGDLGEPANYKAALLDPESDKWLNAMNVEMQSMKDNEVWDLVNLPPNGKTVGSKWLFKKKTDIDGVVRKFIYGLGVVPTIEKPISMYCDNTGAIAIANESGITKGARHFYAKVHYLREVIEFGDIKLEKVHTYDNLAYPFTKALAFLKHSELTRNIGMLPAISLM